MVKKLNSLLSLFGASGYRYNLSLFSFDKVWGLEDAFPDEGGVFVFARRAYDFFRLRFSYEPLYCGATRNLSALSVAKLSKKFPRLLDANCVGVLFEKDAARRAVVANDIMRRNFKAPSK